ncbi:MAG: protein-disulfide reductase DsbD domain-containing protein [Vicinamibacterales bacterium]
MRRLILIAAVLTLPSGAAPGRAQTLLSKPTPQQATVVPSSSVPVVAPGGSVTLWADVTPHRAMHVYAEGATGYTAVSLVLTPNAAVSAGKVSYPKAGVVQVPGTVDRVPAYSGPFRISVPLTVKSTAKPGDVLTLGAALNYQACDDRLCYPAAVAPVLWTLTVR